MSIRGFLFLLLFVVVAVYLVVICNNLVQLKNSVAKAWASIDVLPKQRQGELPKPGGNLQAIDPLRQVNLASRYFSRGWLRFT